MTELQMGLIGLGAISVLAVLAYNKWQENRHRKIAQRMMASQHTDILFDGIASSGTVHKDDAEDPVLLDTTDVLTGELTSPEPHATRNSGERVEPILSGEPHCDSIEPSEGRNAGEREETAGDVEKDADKPLGKRVPESHRPQFAATDSAMYDQSAGEKQAGTAKEITFPFHLLSPLIDYIASFETIEAASAHQILESQRDFLVRVRKPIHWLGFNEQQHEWERIIDDGKNEYRHLCIGLQLVDRKGPVSEGDLSIFHLAMQDLADELMAVVDLPPRQYVLETAVQLDRFSAGVDIQIGLNILSLIQPFAGTKLRALAEAAGMTFDDQGHFVRCDDDGNVLYRLSNQAEMGFSADNMKMLSTHGITFLLDVPRVAHGDRVFNQMLDIAQRFAEALQGSLVDDNRRPLSHGELDPILRQVVEYQAAMASRNLPAGGHLALRLFS